MLAAYDKRYREVHECCGKPLKLMKYRYAKECQVCGAVYFSDAERVKHQREISEANKQAVIESKLSKLDKRGRKKKEVI